MSIVLDNNYYSDKTITRSFSLKNSHIGFDDVVSDSVLSGSAAAGFPVSALNNKFTYDFYRSSSINFSIIVDAGIVKTVDYIGIAKHNLANQRLKLSASSNGVDYVDVVEFIPTDNNALMIIFEAISARYFKLERLSYGGASMEFNFYSQSYSTVTDAAFAQIAVLNIGRALEMQRMIFGGHNPAKLGREAEIRPNTSEGGAFLGRSIIRQGAQCEYSFSNLEGNWYRAYFDPFAAHALTKPFFIAWRPFGYANECQFAWTDKPIKPANTGPNNWLSVSFNVIGCD